MAQNAQFSAPEAAAGTTEIAAQIESVRAAVQPIGNALQQSCLTGPMQRADIGRLNKNSPG